MAEAAPAVKGCLLFSVEKSTRAFSAHIKTLQHGGSDYSSDHVECDGNHFLNAAWNEKKWSKRQRRNGCGECLPADKKGNTNLRWEMSHRCLHTPTDSVIWRRLEKLSSVAPNTRQQ